MPFLYRINCSFDRTVVLTDNERCSIYNLQAEKHWGSKKIMKMFSSEWVGFLKLQITNSKR